MPRRLGQRRPLAFGSRTCKIHRAPKKAPVYGPGSCQYRGSRRAQRSTGLARKCPRPLEHQPPLQWLALAGRSEARPRQSLGSNGVLMTSCRPLFLSMLVVAGCRSSLPSSSPRLVHDQTFRQIPLLKSPCQLILYLMTGEISEDDLDSPEADLVAAACR